MIGSAEKQALLKIVIGCLRSNVNDHGDVVQDSWIGSAAKRICNQILAADNLKVEYRKRDQT